MQTGGGALPGSLSRDVAELRERGLLCGHITAAPAYGGEHEALSTRRRPRRRRDRLGWDAVLVGPGPGIIGSDTEFGHGGMAALDSAHAALSPAPADPALAAPLLRRPARAPPRPQPPHPHRPRAPPRPGRRRRPGGRATGDRSPQLEAAAGDRHRLRTAPVDLDAYAASGLPTTTMGRSLAEDPLFFAAPLGRRAACCVAVTPQWHRPRAAARSLAAERV